MSRKFGSLDLSQLYGPLRPVTGITLFIFLLNKQSHIAENVWFSILDIRCELTTLTVKKVSKSANVTQGHGLRQFLWNDTQTTENGYQNGTCSGYGPLVGSCEHGNEFWDPYNASNIFIS
jgi:hypothetical protein